MNKKILAVGDVQVCPKSYQHVDAFLNKYLYNIIVKEDIDFVVFPGDLFEYSNYTNNYVSSASIIEPFMRFFSKLEKIKHSSCKNFDKTVEVIIVDGNHDKSHGSFANANDIFKGSNIVHVSNTIDIYSPTCSNFTFILLPWLMPHEFESKIDLLDHISSLAIQARENSRQPILVGHIRIIGLEGLDKHVAKSDYSFTFSKDEICNLGIDYGILGDIHIQQNVCKHIDYIGCVRQRNFGEAGNRTAIKIITVEDENTIFEKYIDIDCFPNYHILKADTDEELEKLLSEHKFNANDFYRIDVPFQTFVKSSVDNVVIRGTFKQKIKNNAVSKMKGDIKGEDLIRIYNDHTKEFADPGQVIDFWEKNK